MHLFFSFAPALQRNLAIFFVASLCFWGGLSGLLPNLALYIQSYGASNQQIGWVMAAFAIGLLGFRPKMSRFTDRAGRKPALLIGVGVIALAPLMYLAGAWIPAVELAIPVLGWQISAAILFLAGVRAFHGLSVAAFATAYQAAIADMAPPQHRGELISLMSLAGPLGMAIGPAIGGYLQDNFTAAFLTMTALGLGGLLCVLASQEPTGGVAASSDSLLEPAASSGAEPSAAASGVSKPDSSAFWRLLLLPAVRIPALMLLMVGIAFGAMVTFVPLYVSQRGWEMNIGLVFTVSAITSFSVRTFTGKASDRLGRGRFISLGLLFYTLAMVTLALAVNPPMLLLAGALQGAGSGTTIPIMAALMADRSQPQSRGLTFGLCLTGFDLGIALAGPVMGQVADFANSYSVAFAIAAAMTLLGLLIFLTASSKDLPHSIRFALADGRDVYAIRQ